MSRYFDRNGRPMERLEWAKAFENPDRVIARTKLSDGAEVSTVWLGLDHGWDEGPPLIFETMVFGGPRDGDCERYSTEEEARAGHEAVVAKLSGSPPPGGDTTP